MQTNELNAWIYRVLTQNGQFMSFDQLDQMLAKETKDWSNELRRSYLRGELGRMIRNGQIVREKGVARYKIGEDVNLF